jgi:hypothetical protein
LDLVPGCTVRSVNFRFVFRSLWPVSLVDLNCIVSLPHMCTTFSWSYFLADVPLSPFPGGLTPQCSARGFAFPFSVLICGVESPV